jgi:hypothetical protein
MRWLGIVAYVGALLMPSVAHAETLAPPVCYPGELHPESMRIPANVSSFLLAEIGYAFLSPEIRLVRRMGTTDVEQGLDILEGRLDLGSQYWNLVPTEPLVEGGVYVFIDETCYAAHETRYEVDATVDLPTTLGVTTVSELRATRDRADRPLQYYVRVALELSAEAAAAPPIYEVRTEVEGVEGWLWRPLEGYETEVGVSCGSVAGGLLVEPGLAVVSHLAQAYGAEPSLFTEPVEVDLDCAAAVRVDPMDEHVLTPVEIEEMDRIPDGGFPDPIMDAGAGDPALGGGGCGCGSAGPIGNGALGWLMLVTVALAARRRR